MRVAILILSIFASGCGGPRVPPSIWTDGPSARALEIASAIRSRTASFETLRAGLEITWDDPVTGVRESCRGSLSYARPDKLRLRGTSAAFFTVFDLVSGPDGVWFDIPREEIVVFGQADDPAWGGLPLSPTRLLIALLADPCPDGDCLDSILRVETLEKGFRLVAQNWSMTVDRETGLPLQYVDSGDQPFEVSWRGWRLRHGIAWPDELTIVGTQGALGVSLGRILVGKGVSSSRFTFELDANRELLSPKEAMARWRRPAP